VGGDVANSKYAFCFGKTHTSSFARIQGKKAIQKNCYPAREKNNVQMKQQCLNKEEHSTQF